MGLESDNEVNKKHECRKQQVPSLCHESRHWVFLLAEGCIKGTWGWMVSLPDLRISTSWQLLYLLLCNKI